MGIRDFAIRLLNVTPREAVKAASYGSSWRTMWMSGTESSVSGLTLPDTPSGWRMAARMVWAANAIDARAKAVSQATLGLYQPKDTAQEDAEDGDELIDHPALDLLSTPNQATLDGVSLLGVVERQLTLYGDCLIHAVLGSRDEPAELELLSPELIELERNEHGYVTGYLDRVHGLRYSIEDVVRVHYPSDYDSFVARSPMSSAIDSINRYLLADFAQQAIDRRGGQGGGIVSVNLSQLIDEERFKAEWDAIRSDPRNAGRDAFVPPGTDYKSGVLTAQQQQREERIARLRKEILAGLNVPPACAGDYSDASVLANADLQWKQFWQGWGVSECDMIAQRLTRAFLWRYWPDAKERGLYLAFDYGNIPALQQNAGEAVDVDVKRATLAVSLRSGKLASLNEAREMVGLEPIDDPRADEVLPDEQPEAQDVPVEASVTPSLNADQTAPDQAPAQDGPDEEVTNALPAKATLPIVDFVGMTAVALDGEPVGRIEKIHRFGAHDGIEATKATPVVIIDGRAWRASELRVSLEDGSGEA